MLACAVALAAHAKITLNRWLNLGNQVKYVF